MQKGLLATNNAKSYDSIKALKQMYKPTKQNTSLVLAYSTDQMDLNDLCQTFVSSRPKKRSESLIGKAALC